MPGVSAPDTFRDEALYAFPFDLNRGSFHYDKKIARGGLHIRAMILGRCPLSSMSRDLKTSPFQPRSARIPTPRQQCRYSCWNDVEPREVVAPETRSRPDTAGFDVLQS